MREHVLRVYIVEVVCKGFTSRISQEGYFSLEDAQQFIERRVDCPEKVSNFQFKSKSGDTYYIHDVLVRGK